MGPAGPRAGERETRAARLSAHATDGACVYVSRRSSTPRSGHSRPSPAEAAPQVPGLRCQGAEDVIGMPERGRGPQQLLARQTAPLPSRSPPSLSKHSQRLAQLLKEHCLADGGDLQVR